MARWPRSERLTIKVLYRGGAEAWWLIEARGSHGVFPGHACLEDVMQQVMNEPGHAETFQSRGGRALAGGGHLEP